jgi:integrase
MLAKISKPLVANIQAASQDITVVDTILSGLELRVRPSGSKTWVFRYRIDGGLQQRLRLGRFPGLSVAQARELALLAAADVAKGIDVRARQKEARAAAARERASTLGKFIEEQYQPWAKTHLHTWEFQIRRIKKDFATWLEKPMMSIDEPLIEKWRAERKDAGTQPVTINRKLQRLHAVLAKAVDRKIILRHPFAGLKPLKCDRTGRIRFLNEEEEKQLRSRLIAREQEHRAERERYIEHCRVRGLRLLATRKEEYTDHLRPIVLLAFNTGLRRGEIFHLKWKDVNLKTKWLTVVGTTSKNRQTRQVPLNIEAIHVLEGWRRQFVKVTPAAYVFPGAGEKALTAITTAWRGVRESAALEDFHFHDLRHHFASRLVQSGVDLNTVRELLGHADITMVLRYAHLAPDGLALAVEKVARSAASLEKTSSRLCDGKHETDASRSAPSI